MSQKKPSTAENKFAGSHTALKIDIVAEYSKQYLTALKKTNFRTVFIDPFAGTGEIASKSANADLFSQNAPVALVGSAARALGLPTPFDAYVFGDKSKRKLLALERLTKQTFPHLAARAKFVCGDADDTIRQFCAEISGSKTRAVAFLDPFGNQVSWSTIEAISKTRKIDLWYLFPAGDGVVRQIRKIGGPIPDAVESINRLLGPVDWANSYVSADAQPDLLDGSRIHIRRRVDPKKVTDDFMHNLRQLFGWGVLDTVIPLGPNKRHAYSLIFACGNPKGSDIAKRIAQGVIDSMRKKYLGRPE